MLEFTGKIKAVETRDTLYFDVVDEETGASFNRFLKTLKERYPDMKVRVKISSVASPTIMMVVDGTLVEFVIDEPKPDGGLHDRMVCCSMGGHKW